MKHGSITINHREKNNQKTCFHGENALKKAKAILPAGKVWQLFFGEKKVVVVRILAYIH